MNHAQSRNRPARREEAGRREIAGACEGRPPHPGPKGEKSKRLRRALLDRARRHSIKPGPGRDGTGRARPDRGLRCVSRRSIVASLQRCGLGARCVCLLRLGVVMHDCLSSCSIANKSAPQLESASSYTPRRTDNDASRIRRKSCPRETIMAGNEGEREAWERERERRKETAQLPACNYRAARAFLLVPPFRGRVRFRLRGIITKGMKGFRLLLSLFTAPSN